MPTIYTRSGDKGETWAPLAGRVRKSHVCVEAVGDLDEAESFLALAEAHAREEGDFETAKILEYAQRLLFLVGFQLWRWGTSGKGREKCIDSDEVKKIEALIDRLLPNPPRLFQLHAPDRLAASIAVARAATRRAERSVWRCLDSLRIRPEGALEDALKVLNRLSDLLFALEYRVAERKGLLRHVTC